MHDIGIYAWKVFNYWSKFTAITWDLGDEGAGKTSTPDVLLNGDGDAPTTTTPS
jgi:hypothetical protein